KQAYTLPIVVTRKKWKKVTRKLQERYSQTNSDKSPHLHCANENLFPAVNNKTSALLVAVVAIKGLPQTVPDP
ncbi:MAG: hypothetical protein WCF77_01915, partial [Minisyncoccia bacterium]